MKQRTLAREASIKGVALHTGDTVTLTLKPAPVGHGVVFKRIDLSRRPGNHAMGRFGDRRGAGHDNPVRARQDPYRGARAERSLHGCGVDNVLIEMDASEPPIMDGFLGPAIRQSDPVGRAGGTGAGPRNISRSKPRCRSRRETPRSSRCRSTAY